MSRLDGTSQPAAAQDGQDEVRAESVNAFFANLDRSATAIVSDNPMLIGTPSSDFAGMLSTND